MIAYASNTGTKRNLAELEKYEWRILLTPKNPKLPAKCKGFGIDNGRWSSYTQKEPPDDEGFMRLVETHGGAADFIVIPDVVGEGQRSLITSEQWMRSKLNNGMPKRLLLAIQDGMSVDEVSAFVRQWRVGIFLGGTTEWKLKTLYYWGCVAHALNCYYHVGRVNTIRRIRLVF